MDVIVFEYEVEEWICRSLKIQYGSYIKPSRALSDWSSNMKGEKYHKRDLPKFVGELDLSLLRRKDEIFKNLINYLNKKFK